MFFPSFVIECSHCPRVTGTYSGTFRYLESKFHLSNISNMQQNISSWKKITTTTNPLSFFIKGSTLAKCFLSISPLWLSSLQLFRGSKSRSPGQFQYHQLQKLPFSHPILLILYRSSYHPVFSNIPMLTAPTGEMEILWKGTFNTCTTYKSSPVSGQSEASVFPATHTHFWSCSLISHWLSEPSGEALHLLVFLKYFCKLSWWTRKTKLAQVDLIHH